MDVMGILLYLDDVLYYPILVVVLVAAGLYFTVRTGLMQIRLFPECFRVLLEKPEGGEVSSFQALMVSTASRVGTGNIIGISTAICLGGPGAVFWMWAIALIGGSTAFIESTLAQVFKRRSKLGLSYGGPAYYIESALHNRFLACIFAVFLILTYAGGFNMLCAYNLQSTFAAYSFYDASTTPWVLGALQAVLVAYCILGGGRRIMKVTAVMVPVMGVIYILAAVVTIFMNIGYLPHVLGMIFSDAFNFEAILGGVGGSCLMYGVKRGLFSNEAGIGSAPNAAASADVSHPVKQGLVQMFSVFLDTFLVCSATAFMCLMSGVDITKEAAGAPYVQSAVTTVFGEFGPVLITVSMILFAFSTLIGNLYYVDNNVSFLHHGEPGKGFMTVFRLFCAFVVFVGAGLTMDAAWAIADILMAFMALINIPSILILGNIAIQAMKDYEAQRREGKNPVFRAKNIKGLDRFLERLIIQQIPCLQRRGIFYAENHKAGEKYI